MKLEIAPYGPSRLSEPGHCKQPASNGQGTHRAPHLRSMVRTLALSIAISAALLCGPLDDAFAAGGGGGEMDRMVPLAPMPITIIHQAKVKGILMVEIYLEAHDFDEVQRINQFMPRLLDAYRTGLNQFAAHEVRLDRLINLNRLELYIDRETRSVLGNNGIHVVFKQIMVQKR